MAHSFAFNGRLLLFAVPILAALMVVEGNYPFGETVAPWRRRNTSSIIRNVVEAHSRTLTRIYLPFAVTENIVPEGFQATLEFKANPAKFENMTRAFLYINALNTSFPEGEWAWTLTGGMSSLGNSTQMSSIGSFSSPTDPFNVFYYLHNLTNPSPPMDVKTREQMNNIRFMFKVTRPCPFCQPFLDTQLRFPYLKLDYYTTDVEIGGGPHSPV